MSSSYREKWGTAAKPKVKAPIKKCKIIFYTAIAFVQLTKIMLVEIVRVGLEENIVENTRNGTRLDNSKRIDYIKSC